jgi:hypothetical protein
MSDPVQMKIRVPAEIKEWLEAQAALHQSSQASEVVRAVRERMARSEQVTGA